MSEQCDTVGCLGCFGLGQEDHPHPHPPEVLAETLHFANWCIRAVVDLIIKKDGHLGFKEDTLEMLRIACSNAIAPFHKKQPLASVNPKIQRFLQSLYASTQPDQFRFGNAPAVGAKECEFKGNCAYLLAFCNCTGRHNIARDLYAACNRAFVVLCRLILYGTVDIASQCPALPQKRTHKDAIDWVDFLKLGWSLPAKAKRSIPVLQDLDQW